MWLHLAKEFAITAYLWQYSALKLPNSTLKSTNINF